MGFSRHLKGRRLTVLAATAMICIASQAEADGELLRNQSLADRLDSRISDALVEDSRIVEKTQKELQLVKQPLRPQLQRSVLVEGGRTRPVSTGVSRVRRVAASQ